jgi:amidase
MPIPAPTADDVRTISEALGLKLTPADVETYAGFVSGMVESYRRLDAMDAPTPVKPGRGRVGKAPAAADNPYNAWVWMGPIEPTGKGLLDGCEVGIKDAICVAGMPARNGSPLLADFVPDIDATVVTRILAAGGTIKGKTACENLSFSGHSHTSNPPVLNPHRTTHSTGGSSSGNGAAIAAGDIAMAIGCDQGGSVRIPASWSGIVGLKPTHGLVPYTGAFAMDTTIDYCGPMGARVEDVARLLSVIAGPDGLDARQNKAVPIPSGVNYLDALSSSRRPARIGVVREGFGRPESEAETDRIVREALKRFGGAGVEIEEFSMPEHLLCFDVWNAIVVGGTSELMFKQDGIGGFGEGYADPGMLAAFAKWRDRPDQISVTAMPALLMGAIIQAQHHGRHYAKAQTLLRTMRAGIDAALARYDVLAMPTIPFRALAHPAPDAGLAERINLGLPMVGNTAPYNASGHPAISVPCGSHEALPVGLMLIGRHFGEADLLAAASFFEQTA